MALHAPGTVRTMKEGTYRVCFQRLEFRLQDLQRLELTLQLCSSASCCVVGHPSVRATERSCGVDGDQASRTNVGVARNRTQEFLFWLLEEPLSPNSGKRLLVFATRLTRRAQQLLCVVANT